MQAYAKLLGILAVLAVGVCAALPFRIDPSDRPLRKPTEEPLPLALQAPPAQRLAPLTDPAGLDAAAPTRLTPDAPTGRERRATPSAVLAEPHWASAPGGWEPPEFAVGYDPLLDPDPSAGSPAAPTRESASAPPVQWHEIRDGDSLKRLAERHLGDASRWTEIFAANRDRLDDPDLLPLGERIRLP